jgi:hypothetical protein
MSLSTHSDRDVRYFNTGDVVEDEDGVRYRVTRAYVPPEPGYFDLNSFELVRETPPEPFVQAGSLADKYRRVRRA